MNGDRYAGHGLKKNPTGIKGLDEVTFGGLPEGRPTLITGGAGSGKTVMGMEFIIRGIVNYDEPGVFVTFEETTEELVNNFTSLNYDLDALCDNRKLVVEQITVDKSDFTETGEYDLNGLFIRIGHAIDSIGAKRITLDTLEAIFPVFTDAGLVRTEMRRLFRWLKSKGVTAVVTGERGEGTITRYGLEEYVADCVIVLDQHIVDQVVTRRMRILKYRGSAHGTNEYPFLIDNDGITVIPITSLGLKHPASEERVSTGIERLDAMLDDRGFYRGSSILVSGTSGTGKTSIAACFVDAACRRGEKAVYFAFEESRDQVIRNMRSIGIDLQQWVDNELLIFEATRPTLRGLEMHLVTMIKAITEHDPSIVVIDPISNLTAIGNINDVKAMLTRLIDVLKNRKITALFTSLTLGGAQLERNEIGISSLMDVWINLRNIESNGERNRGLYVLKSRGMPHSNQIREFIFTKHGVELTDVYLGPSGILTGSARLIQEAKDTAQALERSQELEARQRELERKRKLIDVQIEALQAEYESEEEELRKAIAQEEMREAIKAESRARLAMFRSADSGPIEERKRSGESDE